MPNISSLLLPYQQKWLKDESPVKIWEKSRRIGATWAEAADAVLIAGRDRAPMDYYYSSINESLSREFIRDAAKWAETFNIVISEIGETLLKDGEKSIRVQQIIFASGKKIMGVPSNPSVLRGRTGVLTADEFGFIDNPQELLKAGMAFLIWGGKVRILSTHNGDNSHFNELIKETRAGKLKYSLHRTTLDDALEQGLYKRICLQSSRKWSSNEERDWKQELIDLYGAGADEELFCIPNNSAGNYFPRVLVEQCMDESVPVINLTLDKNFALQTAGQKKVCVLDWLADNLTDLVNRLQPNYKTSFGFDFGRSGDLSYLIVFQETPNLTRKTAFALELRNVPYQQQEDILFWILDKLPRFIGGAMDALGNGAYLAEKAADRYGEHRILQVKLSQQWYLENMPKYKAALEDKKVILPANSDLLDDHRLVEVIKGIPKIPDKRTKGSDGKQRHGDGAIALALGWFASLNEGCNNYIALPPTYYSQSARAA